MTPDLFTTAAEPVACGAKPARGKRITFNVYKGEDVRTITPAGRDAWALIKLIFAAGNGITSLENPAPRLAHYVFKLRTVFGLNIETITEGHAGEFAGHHARYVLRSRVSFADPADEARARCAP